MKIKINNIEIACLLLLLLFSSIIGITPYISISISQIDSYFSVIIGALLGFIPLFILIYLFNFEEDKNIFEKTVIIFGKVLGHFINTFLIIIFLIIGATILFSISNFIVSQYLTKTPLILIITVLSLTVLFAVNKGINTISHASFIFVIINIILFFISLLGLAGEIKIDNLKPILKFGLKSPIIAGLINTLLFTSPLYMILAIPKNKIADNKKSTKYLTISYLISTIMIFIIAFIISSILGKYLLTIYQYPTYIAFKKISLFGFIDRIENFLAMQYILACFITLSMTIYYIKERISLKKKNNNIINLIITIVLIITAYFSFPNNTSFNYYLVHIYPIILLSLFIIHIIILIGAVIKKKIKNICIIKGI